MIEISKPITPDVWGPHGWKFLHYVTFGYPENPTNQDKENYKKFFYSLANVLPCKKCSNNFKKNLADYPIESGLENKDSLIKWMIDVHNAVNYELDKPILEYDDAMDIYINHSRNDKLFKLAVLIIILGFIYLCIKK